MVVILASYDGPISAHQLLSLKPMHFSPGNEAKQLLTGSIYVLASVHVWAYTLLTVMANKAT